MRVRPLYPEIQLTVMRRWTMHVLAAVALLTAPMAVFAPRGLAPLFIVAAVFALAGSGRRVATTLGDVKALGALLGALAVWGAVGAFWSIRPEASLALSLRLLGVFVAGLVIVAAARSLAARERVAINTALVAGLVLALALLVVEFITDAALTRLVKPPGPGMAFNYSVFNNGATVAALILWPCVATLLRRGQRKAAAILVLATVAVLSQSQSLAAVFAVAVGIAVFAIAFAAPRPVASAMAGLIFLGVMVAPLLPLTVMAPGRVDAIYSDMPNEGRHRLVIWEFVADRIGERPVLGWGLDASRDMPGGQRLVRPIEAVRAVLPLHPHNAALQLWLELGAPGAVLGGLLVSWVVLSIRRCEARRDETAASLALVAVAVVIASLAYGIWQTWWLAALWLSAVFALVALEEPLPKAEKGSDGPVSFESPPRPDDAVGH